MGRHNTIFRTSGHKSEVAGSGATDDDKAKGAQKRSGKGAGRAITWHDGSMLSRGFPMSLAAVAVAAFVAGCSKDERAAPSPARSGAVASTDQPSDSGATSADPPDDLRPSKEFSVHSENLAIGETKTIDGASVELVSTTNTSATFRVDGKDTTANTGACFEAGEHKCDVHKSGSKTWCVSRAWDTGAVMAPKGHH